ncbi:MAG: AMP-binding protein [Pirellulales bacterium]
MPRDNMASFDTRLETVPWIEGLTIGQAFDATVVRVASHDALVFPQLGLKWTWAEFAARRRDRPRVVGHRSAPGEHMAVWATNVPQWALLQFASAKIGVVLVTINPAYRPFELEYVLRQSDALRVVLDRRL